MKCLYKFEKPRNICSCLRWGYRSIQNCRHFIVVGANLSAFKNISEERYGRFVELTLLHFYMQSISEQVEGWWQNHMVYEVLEIGRCCYWKLAVGCVTSQKLDWDLEDLSTATSNHASFRVALIPFFHSNGEFKLHQVVLTMSRGPKASCCSLWSAVWVN